MFIKERGGGKYQEGKMNAKSQKQQLTAHTLLHTHQIQSKITNQTLAKPQCTLLEDAREGWSKVHPFD